MLWLLMILMSAFVSSCAWDRYQTNVDPKELAALAREPVVTHAEKVSGVDLWASGLPNRKYKILGIIRDKRRAWRFKTFYQDIAEITKKEGGDAAIIVLADSRTFVKTEHCISGMLPQSACDDKSSGASFNPEAPGSEMTIYSENRESNQAPLEFRESHILVIKYLP